MQVDKKDAEEGRDRGKAFLVEQNEYEQYEDADYFDSGAAGHTICEVVNEVDKVAAHGQHDKGIQPPEAGLGVLSRGCYCLVFQLVLRIGYIKNILKNQDVQYPKKICAVK